MNRLSTAGLSLVLLLLALLVGSAQAGQAKPRANTLKQTVKPIWTLAMDGPRVAYASGGRVYVWNVVTGATSVVKGVYAKNPAPCCLGNPTPVAANEIAIAGKRVAWIRQQQVGNTELYQWLYTAPLGGWAHLLRKVLGYTNTDCGVGGPQIAGLVASGSVLAVSTWTYDNAGTSFTNERLNMITPTRLRTIAWGPSAVESVSADAGHIVVVPLPTMSMEPGYCVVATKSNSVVIRSASGELLRQIAISPSGEIALSGTRLVAAIGSPTPALAVYDSMTGELQHTWPFVGAASVPGPHQEGHVQVYGRLAMYSVYTQYVGGFEKLHLLDLNTGKDVVVTIVKGFGDNREWAIGSRGLVYVVNYGRPAHGKLVFVPMATLLAMLK